MKTEYKIEDKDLITAIFQNLLDGIAVIGIDNKFKIFSPGMKKLIGYDIEEVPTLEIAIEKLFTDPSLKAEVFELWQKDIKSDHPPARTFFIKHKNGEKRWCRFQLSPLNEDNIIINGQDITELKETEKALNYRIEIEKLVTSISTNFINLPSGEIDHGINKSLKRLGEFIEVDQSYLNWFYGNTTEERNIYEWCAKGIKPQIQRLKEESFDDLTWFREKMINLETIFINDISDIPVKAEAERKLLREWVIKSLVVVPVVYGGYPVGALVFISVREKKTWSEDVINQFKIIGEVFANALMRKKAEELRLESEESYRELADSIGDIFFAMDKNLRYTYRNEAAEKFTGISSKESIGKSPFEIFPDKEETRKAMNIYEDVLKTQKSGIFVNEFKNRGKNYFLEFNVYPSKNGISVIAKDITEHKQAEEALRKSEAKFKELADLLPQTVFEIDLEGNFTFANRYGFESSGYSQEDMDKGLSALQLFIPRDRERVKENIKKILSGEKLRGNEYTALKKDGSTYPVITYSSPIVHENKLVGLRGIVIDITERKHMEEALRESEEKYREMVENIKDVIYVVDREGIVTYISPVIESILEFNVSELVGKCFLEFIYHEDISFVKKNYQSIISGKIEENEYRVLTKSGEIRWIRTSSKPIYDEDQVIGLRGVVSDITKRKEVEEALSKSEEKYRKVVENIYDIVYSAYSDGIIYFASPNAVSMTGYEPEEVIGHNLIEFVHPDDIEHVLSDYEKTIKTGEEFPTIFRLIKKDGSYFYVEEFGKVVKEGDKIIGVTGVLRNITERKLAEEMLKKSELQYRLMIDSMTDVIHVVDCDLRLIIFNEKLTSWNKKLGLKTDVAGKNIFDICPFLTDKIRDEYYQVINTGKVLITEENNKIGDTEFITETRKIPIIEQGKVTKVITVITDITGKKRLEEQLHRSQKMESLGRLAGGVAHDLNHILMGLVTYPDLMLMEMPEDNPLREHVSAIRKSGQKAADIVQDLLTLARGGVIDKEVLNLNNIINDYIKSPEFKELKKSFSNVKFKTNFESQLFNISGSNIQLSKVLMNLVKNAAESIIKSGNVIISTENQYVDKPVRGYDEDIPEGDYMVLRISDTGTGISQDNLEKIFEPFYTKKSAGIDGTGFGLPVVWGTVKDHEGYINVKSTENKGTVFEIYFPIVREKLDNEKSHYSIEDYLGSGEEILVVDDMKEQRYLAVKILTNLGYSVDAVSSGEEAVEYMRKKSADLIVLDMIMEPGMNGLQTYKKILEFHPEQKAIIISGLATAEQIREIQKLGAGAYIKKPYTSHKIGVTVRTELDK